MKKTIDQASALADILSSNLRSMALAASMLRDQFPATGGLDSGNQNNYDIWSRVGVPDALTGTYQEPDPKQLAETPGIFASAILEEVCRLLFPTQNRDVDIDVVLRTEGRSCEFCIVGSMSIEKIGLLIEHLESKRRLLLQK